MAGNTVDVEVAECGGGSEVGGPGLAFEGDDVELVADQRVFSAVGGAFFVGEVQTSSIEQEVSEGQKDAVHSG